MSRPLIEKPFLGFGLGLRTDFYETILNEKPALDWLEIITENYLIPGGKPLYYLDKIREHYPMAMHGVSLSIGSADPLDNDYLHQIKHLAQRLQPAWISDHLCWTGIHGKNTHDLLPLPYTEEAINHVVARIQYVQDFLQQRILIENVSSYINYKQSTLSEWDFLAEICQRADCFILLDINNVFVNAINHEFNPADYIYALPSERIYQIHLAGHSHQDNHLIDTHDYPVANAVWDLYQMTLNHHGIISTLLERDDKIPEFNELLLELNHAREIAYSIGSDIIL